MHGKAPRSAARRTSGERIRGIDPEALERDEQDALRVTWPPPPAVQAVRSVSVEEALVPRRKQVRDEPEVTVWPSSLPEDVGSMMPGDRDLAMEFDELGSRFLSGAVEQGTGCRLHCDEELDEPYFDAQVGNEILRSFGLQPMPTRRSLRPPRASTSPRASKAPKSLLPGMPDEAILRSALRPPALPRMPPPEDFDDFQIDESMEIDLTEQTIREASLLDHEADEAGEVESPFVRTDDVHSHLKRRGGHARTSMRPPRAGGAKR